MSCMIYVGNLIPSTTQDEVEKACEKVGPVVSSWLSQDPASFGFVEFKSARDAQVAVKELDGTTIGSSTKVRVEISIKRGKPGQPDRSFYAGRGRGRPPPRPERDGPPDRRRDVGRFDLGRQRSPPRRRSPIGRRELSGRPMLGGLRGVSPRRDSLLDRYALEQRIREEARLLDRIDQLGGRGLRADLLLGRDPLLPRDSLGYDRLRDEYTSLLEDHSRRLHTSLFPSRPAQLSPPGRRSRSPVRRRLSPGSRHRGNYPGTHSGRGGSLERLGRPERGRDAGGSGGVRDFRGERSGRERDSRGVGSGGDRRPPVQPLLGALRAARAGERDRDGYRGAGGGSARLSDGYGRRDGGGVGGGSSSSSGGRGGSMRSRRDIGGSSMRGGLGRGPSGRY